MEALLLLGVGFVGLIAGAFVFSRVASWLVGIHTALRKRAGSSSQAAGLGTAVFLASGPWVVLGVSVLGLSVRNQAWAPWLFGGFGAAIVLFVLITIYFTLKAAKAGRNNAA